ncbi:PEP/pyruvate-binding domain-containing protein [Rhodococcus qingshengii]|uniref:PEP/pyruvate-binding domain-containing protein n=1 Tax=Rhodococcus qingshengii TaxID=334542 RepID=UPI00211E6BA8
MLGGKAVGLSSMIRLGLNVPAGFVVTTEAYRHSVGQSLTAQIDDIVRNAHTPEELNLASAEIRALFAPSLISESLRADIAAAYEALGGDGTEASVAIRSSATAEDLEHASFAGQQDTFLWVTGLESVLSKLAECWSSLFTPQVIGYRRKFGVASDGLAMGVVVQTMVPADSAGVMMTLDPVTGNRSTAYIEAALGLGEGVVKGDVTSDSFWVSANGEDVRSEIRLQDNAHRFDPQQGCVALLPVDEQMRSLPAISHDEAKEIATLGRHLQAQLGGPQDVEWAFGPRNGDGPRELFLLQTRAETVWSRAGQSNAESVADLATAEGVDPDEVTLLHGHAARDGLWTITNMQEAIPGVETPLTWSVWLPVSEFVNRNHYRFVGALSRREAQVPHRTQDWMVGVFYGRAALRIDMLASWADRVPGMSGSDLIAQFFSSLPEGVESRPQRKYYLRALLRRPLPFIVVPRRMRANRANVEAFWHESVRELASSDLPRTVELLDAAIEKFAKSLALQVNLTQGAFLTTSKMLRKLAGDSNIPMHELVAGYGGHEETALVDDMWSLSRDEITMDEFLRRHGYHGWREGELSNRSWREDPVMVERQLEAYRGRPDAEDPRTSAKLRMVKRQTLEKKLLQSLPKHRRLYALLVLKLSAHYLPMRGVSKTAFLQALDVIRGASRRAGVLLTETGDLPFPDDVFYLTVDEIRSKRVPFGARVVDERRALRARYEAVEIPDAWQGVAAPEVVGPAESIETIIGTPASPGLVEGYARVVLDPSDAHVEKGEILLAKDTDPGWASLMFLSSALVADIGGVMSHTAVVARELGIPCVVNTKVATRHIATGDYIRIDGSKGTIDVLVRAEGSDKAELSVLSR